MSQLASIAVGDRPEQLSPEPEHLEVIVERDLLATVACNVSLVCDSISAIRFAIAPVSDQITFVREPFALVCSHLAQFGTPVAFVSFLLA